MFKTKAYTINYFIKVLSDRKVKQSDIQFGLFALLSPTKGKNSVKVNVLNHYLGGETNTIQIVYGIGKFGGFGTTPRKRILKALKLRKKNGTI